MEQTSDILEISACDATPSRLADFYELTKPRMNFLVVITTMVGYYMASRGGVNGNLAWTRLCNTLLGTLLCASSAGVLNQVIERKHDAKMHRTRNRAIPANRVTVREATLFGSLLGIAGVSYLAFSVNLLTSALGAMTLLSYLAIYTPMKRISTLNTVVGAIPGAIPPLMGFTAVENAITPAALSLFAILFIWQMPHFLAIAILYKDDYARGGFKMLPCVDEGLTARQMVLYALALIPISMVPVLVGIAGPAYFTAAVLLGLAFLSFAISCATSRTRLDARKLFFASIIYLPLLLAAMMIDRM